MADREYFTVKSLALRQKEIHCKFLAATAGATLVTASSRGVASVARDSAGKFTITLVDAHRTGLTPKLALQNNSDATDLYLQFAGYGNLGTSTATTITIRIKKGSTNTDMSSHSNNAVYVTGVFEDSSEAT